MENGVPQSPVPVSRTDLLAALGESFDCAPSGRARLTPTSKRAALARRRAVAEGADEVDLARTLTWELLIVDELLPSGPDGSPASPAILGDAEAFAIAAYAQRRAGETQDLLLRVYYLAFAARRGPQRGREWVDRQRWFVHSLREFAELCFTAVAEEGAAAGSAFLGLIAALSGIVSAAPRQGVLDDAQLTDLMEWIVRLPERVRAFPVGPTGDRAYMRHARTAQLLECLEKFAADRTPSGVRERAKALLAEAGDHFRRGPLTQLLEIEAAEVEALLRSHWREPDTARVKTRRIVAAYESMAVSEERLFQHEAAAHHRRQAHKLVVTHREWFSEVERDAAARAEQAALERLELTHESDAGDPIVLDPSADLTAGTAAATVDALVTYAGRAAPPVATLQAVLADDHLHQELAPRFGRVIVGPGKIVGEAHTAEQSVDLAIAEYVGREAIVAGATVAYTVRSAATRVGLMAADLAAPIRELNIDADTCAMIERGCERMLQGDYISATHVLGPRFEDALRQHLKALGAATTKLERDASEGTARTDDATLGALMRRMLPDGRSVEAYFGADQWRYLDVVMNDPAGLNLRNQIAHGLTRLTHCSAADAGLLLFVLFKLLAIARGVAPPGPA